jgi:UDP-N-acetyl-2-amino-2-deoxyglucuronate dehydrogenase
VRCREPDATSDMTELKAGVIGLGVGEQHLKTYNAIDGCEVVAICDIDGAQLQAVGDRHGVIGRHGDFRQVTENPEIDVVSICSYDDCHAEQVISALNAGKHVMVEKPVALYRDELSAIRAALDASGKLLTSNLILRESPRFLAVKEMADKGEFGDIFYMEGDYLHQILWKITEGWRGKMDFYCTVYGGGIHLIDLMTWIKGEKIVEVSAMGTDIPTRGSDYRWPDTIIALLRFENGAIAKCTSTLAPQRTKFHALNIYGSEKTFVNDIPDAKIFGGGDPADEEAMTVPYPGMRKGDMLPAFVKAIREGGQPHVSSDEVFHIMDVCFAIWDAVQTGRTVPVTNL